ncbi:MAG: hypothetical protein AAF211_06010 [Myxococcota bacterium]
MNESSSPRTGVWVSIRGTDARYRADVNEVDGVGVLSVELDGFVRDGTEPVSRVRDRLDALGVALGDQVEVTVLDVLGFATASGDESQILLSVFLGLPCVWVVTDPDRQDAAGRDWSMPARGWLAHTAQEALERVVDWRRREVVEIATADGGTIEIARWTDRGLRLFLRGLRHDVMEDLYHHNRLVERTYPGTRIRWPHPDRAGELELAQRLGARVVWRDQAVEVVDFSAGPADRAPGWLDALDEVTTATELWLPDGAVGDGDLVTVLASLPGLRQLVLGATTSWGPEVDEALKTGWAPALGTIRGSGRIPEASRDALQRARPDLRLAM